MYKNLTYFKDAFGNVTSIRCEVEGRGLFLMVPLDPANSDYRKIMALVDAGELTIADPD